MMRSPDTIPRMLDRFTMKPQRAEIDGWIPCPVLGCTKMVKRMTRDSKNLNTKPHDLESYLCPDHQIYISPSTFAYRDPNRSLLWLDPVEQVALARIEHGGKRTWSRRARENDEDSLTWNTFRTLQRLGLISQTLAGLLPGYQTGAEPDLIYWAVDPHESKPWAPLACVRQQLGEKLGRGSEPDLIAVSPDAVTIIEVKFTSPSVTPAPKEMPQGYLNEPLWSKVFKAGAGQVVEQIGYELMRFLLVGQQLAQELNLPCRLVSLTHPNKDRELKARVSQVCTGAVRYDHITWADIRRQVTGANPRLQALARYHDGKTAGYDGQGRLQTLL